MKKSASAIIFFASLIAVLFFSSCSCSYERLSVRREALSDHYLASVRAKTPDYRKATPFYGQQLVIEWSIPRIWLRHCEDHLHLEIYLVYNNFERAHFSIPITKCQNFYVYRLLNEEYDTTEGIMTYKVQLIDGGEILQCWAHHTWADWIESPNPESSI